MKVYVLKYKSYTSLSLNPFLLIADKAHLIPIEKLVLPPKNRQIREVDDGFLKQLIRNMEDQPLWLETMRHCLLLPRALKRRKNSALGKLLIMSMRFLEELMWPWQQSTSMKNSLETQITVEELQGFVLDCTMRKLCDLEPCTTTQGLSSSPNIQRWGT